ncbi:hypothetical protein ACFSKW_25805 [Nonomuraea mangrovi]|uniref:Uncharacterized protein n=1 Tax=Nonomuraea mangrovi TaxID=2316207 RepID=A0ABW4SZ31_9ACTN
MLITIPSGGPDHEPFPSWEIEDALRQTLADAGSGEFDGNDMDFETGEVTLFMYGPDTDLLFASAEPVLKRLVLPKGVVAIKRYGEPGAREELVRIT